MLRIHCVGGTFRLASAALILATLVAATARGGEHAPGRLVVQTRKHADPDEVKRIVAALGGRIHVHHLNTSVLVLKVPESHLDSLSAAREKTGLFTFVERD